MLQLLHPVFKGEIEYVGDVYSDKEESKRFVEWAKQLYPEGRVENFYDPTTSYYCIQKYIVYRVNQKLQEGKVIVGSDNYNWIFTDRENIEE